MQKKRRIPVIVYHGSYTDIKEIDLSKAEAAKDFGRGFYVTKIREDAEKMAAKQGKNHNCTGVVSRFKLDYDKAFLHNIYKTKIFDGYTKEWLDFIIINRKNRSDTQQSHEYDIVEGPIADDVVALKIRKLPDNPSETKKQKLLEDLKYYRYTHQVCFCTAISLDTIERINLEPHFEIGDIGDYIINHLKINDRLSEKNALDLYYQSETYKQVSDENTGLYSKSWEEILDMLKKEIETKKISNTKL
jgi:hypothetical protein